MEEWENPPEELNEMQASILSNIEIRVMILKIHNSMKNDMKKWKPGKKDQSEIKNAIFEINNILEGINSRLGETKDQISDVEDKVEKNTQVGHQKEKRT